MASGTLTPFVSVFVVLMVVGGVGNVGLLVSVRGDHARAPLQQLLLLPDLVVVHLGVACLLHALSGGVSLLVTANVCCQELADGFCGTINFLIRYGSTLGGWFTLLLSLYRYAKLRTLDRPSLAVTRLEGATWPRRCCSLLWAAIALVHSPTVWSAISAGSSSYTATTAMSSASTNVVNYVFVWLPVVLMLLSNTQMVRQLWRHRRSVDAESNLGAAVGSGRARACVQAAKVVTWVVLLTVAVYVGCKGAIGAGLAASFVRGSAAPPLPGVSLFMSISGPLFPALCPCLILAGDSKKREALLEALRRALRVAPRRNQEERRGAGED
ncbi:olfactory receptor class A-like protein 4 [Lethenteron reissneri]|uniref:olfactory receptor class A-like protein 4 n=1 Tax=Lethenteron reissneri TaxID=7753 RepID=UPI002AB70A2A|nr:olfactory receptor class A-like protein 4 [Lethenteron reissneri]